jgi:hypothetical protein
MAEDITWEKNIRERRMRAKQPTPTVTYWCVIRALIHPSKRNQPS